MPQCIVCKQEVESVCKGCLECTGCHTINPIVSAIESITTRDIIESTIPKLMETILEYYVNIKIVTGTLNEDYDRPIDLALNFLLIARAIGWEEPETNEELAKALSAALDFEFNDLGDVPRPERMIGLTLMKYLKRMKEKREDTGEADVLGLAKEFLDNLD